MSLAKISKSHQKIHRERIQPEHRKHLGFLEKKKDYKVRSLKYQENQKILKKLRIKAANRNPNEFYLHMINSQIKDGQHYEKRKDTIDVASLQAKNMRFLKWRLSVEQKRIEKLKSQLHFIDIEDKPKNTHIYFTDDREKEKKIKTRLKSGFGDRIYNAPDIEDLRSHLLEEYDPALLQDISKAKIQSYRKLMKYLEREKKIKQMIEKNDFTLES